MQTPRFVRRLLQPLRSTWGQYRQQFVEERWEELPPWVLVLEWCFHVLRITLKHYFRKRLMRTAGGLAFMTSISLIPVLVIVVSIVSALGLLENAGQVLVDALISNLFPVERETASQQIQTFVSNAGDAYAGIVGFGVALLTAILLFNAIDRLLNDIWLVEDRRPLSNRLLIFWGFLTISPPLILVSIILTGQIQVAIQTSLGGITGADAIIPTLFPVILAATGIYVILRFLPNTDVRFLPAFGAALLTAFLFEASKLGFSLYVSQIAKVQWFRIYGAVFLVPVFLVWIQLSWALIAFGAQLAFVAQNFRSLLREDTEVGDIGSDRVNFETVLSVLGVMVEAFESGEGSITRAAISYRVRRTGDALLEVLMNLERAGILESTHGAANLGSRWFLRRPPEKIQVTEALSACGTLPAHSPSKPVLNSVLERIRSAVATETASIDARSLVEQPSPAE